VDEVAGCGHEFPQDICGGVRALRRVRSFDGVDVEVVGAGVLSAWLK
jgi:hypothetical protein